MNKYVLCTQGQNKEQGRAIETEADVNKHKNVELFLKALLQQNEITEEEFNTVELVYYA